MNLRAFAIAPLLVASLLCTRAHAAPAAPTPIAALPTAAAAPADDPTLAAREHFAQAKNLYNDGDFDAALAQFERAYELKPNYKVLYNIGQTYFQLRQYVEAHDAMTRYLKEGGDQIDAERLAAVNRDLADLERRLAKVTLNVNVNGATVLIDGKKAGVTPLSEPLVVSEGQRVISVEVPHRGVLQRQLRVVGGDAPTLTLTFEEAPRTVIVKAAPQDNNPRLGAFWATAVGAVALGAGAGVTGYFAFQAQDDNRRQVKSIDTTPKQLADSDKRATNLALTTDILMGAAVVCAGVAIVVFVTSPSHPRAAQVGVGVGPGSALLSGRF
jgi:tetratricopeptide (TPR) repeat protein